MTKINFNALEPLSQEAFYKSDWFLRMLVNACDHTNAAIPLILNVGGVLISGDLVGGEQYFNGFADDAKRLGADDELTASFRKYAEMYTREMGQEPDPETYAAPQYIHLRNARFFDPGGHVIPNNAGVWWRGRLDAIDGFVSGLLSRDDGLT